MRESKRSDEPDSNFVVSQEETCNYARVLSRLVFLNGLSVACSMQKSNDDT